MTGKEFAACMSIVQDTIDVTQDFISGLKDEDFVLPVLKTDNDILVNTVRGVFSLYREIGYLRYLLRTAAQYVPAEEEITEQDYCESFSLVKSESQAIHGYLNTCTKLVEGSSTDTVSLSKEERVKLEEYFSTGKVPKSLGVIDVHETGLRLLKYIEQLEGNV